MPPSNTPLHHGEIDFCSSQLENLRLVNGETGLRQNNSDNHQSVVIRLIKKKNHKQNNNSNEEESDTMEVEGEGDDDFPTFNWGDIMEMESEENKRYQQLNKEERGRRLFVGNIDLREYSPQRFIIHKPNLQKLQRKSDDPLSEMLISSSLPSNDTFQSCLNCNLKIQDSSSNGDHELVEDEDRKDCFSSKRIEDVKVEEKVVITADLIENRIRMLLWIFQQFGVVEGITIDVEKRFAFILFQSKEMARNALRRLSDYRLRCKYVKQLEEFVRSQMNSSEFSSSWFDSIPLPNFYCRIPKKDLRNPRNKPSKPVASRT